MICLLLLGRIATASAASVLDLEDELERLAQTVAGTTAPTHSLVVVRAEWGLTVEGSALTHDELAARAIAVEVAERLARLGGERFRVVAPESVEAVLESSSRTRCCMPSGLTGCVAPLLNAIAGEGVLVLLELLDNGEWTWVVARAVDGRTGKLLAAPRAQLFTLDLDDLVRHRMSERDPSATVPE